MKKIVLFLGMFLFMTNVNALTFNVDITNIEDKGNNGTMGSITSIDIANTTVNESFSDVGDEVSFDITITNSGNRAGTLRSINVTSTNNKIQYTNNLPENGLAINGNDFNTVTITAKVLQGATNGTSSSEIKITYNYDEGSCPEREILSEDESMCLCPAGTVRNELGLCIIPDEPVNCEDDEIYNTEKKICEKMVIPGDPDDSEPEKEVIPTINPSNPKTMDNIILITLLFFVSGLGIYAVLFKKLNTNKKKVVAAVLTGVTTLGLSFTVLASVFGIDNLLGAIVNPITKKQELIVTVNETIEMIETWDGNCRTTSYAPETVFEGGSGTESDPYQIKTANQLACFAESVTDGNTYEGKFIKQIKDIKLNDHLVEGLSSGGYGYNNWTSAGDFRYGTYFAGTYDGDNHTISGLLITDDSANTYSPKGLFSAAKGATFKNLNLSDVFIEVSKKQTGALVGKAFDSLTIDNVVASGTYSEYSMFNGGIVGVFAGYEYGTIPITANEFVKIENTTNNINRTSGGIIARIDLATENGVVQDGPTVILRNVTNNGTIVSNSSEVVCGGIAGAVSTDNYVNGNVSGTLGYVLIDNAINNGSINDTNERDYVGGLVGIIITKKIEITNSHNVGNIVSSTNDYLNSIGGLVGEVNVPVGGNLVVDNSYNSGNISNRWLDSYENGLTEDEVKTLRRNEFASHIGGLIGIYSHTKYVNVSEPDSIIKDSYNTGDIKGLAYYIGGLMGDYSTSDGFGFLSGDNITIQDSYNEGDLYSVYGNVGGIMALSRGTITGCHNSGNIVLTGYIDSTYDSVPTSNAGFRGQKSGPVAGLVSAHDADYLDDYYESSAQTINPFKGATIIDSYNQGDIIIKAKINKVVAAGLCGSCDTISGSYNSGDITSVYATTILEGISAAVNSTIDTTNEGTITPGSGY